MVLINFTQYKNAIVNLITKREAFEIITNMNKGESEICPFPTSKDKKEGKIKAKRSKLEAMNLWQLHFSIAD